MTEAFIFDKTQKLLEKSMDIAARRHSLITGNIANMDTIGYQPKDLDFKDTLAKAMAKPQGDLDRTNPKHFHRKGVVVDLSGQPRHDATDTYHLDSVDIDTEMTHLIENNIKYRTSVEMLLRKISILRQSITDGGR